MTRIGAELSISMSREDVKFFSQWAGINTLLSGVAMAILRSLTYNSSLLSIARTISTSIFIGTGSILIGTLGMLMMKKSGNA